MRAGALIAVGALGVHDLRYLLAYHGHASEELALQGHAYLRFATPVLAGLLVLAAAAFAARLMRAYAQGEGTGARLLPSTRRMWIFASALLIAVYSSQEWLEGFLAEGHPGGIGAPYSHGGWLAVPLALAIGLVVALALRGAAVAIAVAATHGRTRMLRPARIELPARVGSSVWHPTRNATLSRELAPRAPPASSLGF
jgi:hypothetical protein